MMLYNHTAYYCRHLKYYIAGLLIICILSGCQTNTEPAPATEHYNGNSYNVNADLTNLCDEIFLHMAGSDGITLNYTLSEPEAYGITEYTHGLGDYSVSSMRNDYAYYENKLDILNSIDYTSLNSDDRLMYDTLTRTLAAFLDSAPYVLYHEPLAPVSGIQAQLPVLLSEYHFYNEKCITEYFTLLNSIPEYFRQIIDYELQKKENGLFMCSKEVEKIINQCSDFIDNPENNLLIQVFPDNIKALNLDDNTYSQYVEYNKKLVCDTVIPSYSYLIDSLRNLNTGNSDMRGMCSLPEGKEYYTSLLHIETCSSMSPDEMNSLLNSTLKDCTSSIADIILNNPHAYDNIYKLNYPVTKPDDIINYLTSAISNEYPALPKSAGELNIKYVHPSLEDTLSPAMYITPPIDCEVTDDIYINNSCCDTSSMFTTLAHEAYPGHLYQHEYFMSTNPHPLRLMLGFGGYSEGWATYTELYSYSIAGIDPESASILRNNKLATLCVYSLMDLGIHYYGWSYTDCASFLSDNGITTSSSVDEIYFAVLTEPALYLKYTIGCLEFLNLEAHARDTLGERYDPVAFHEAILRTGPTWFEILASQI